MTEWLNWTELSWWNSLAVFSPFSLSLYILFWLPIFKDNLSFMFLPDYNNITQESAFFFSVPGIPVLYQSICPFTYSCICHTLTKYLLCTMHCIRHHGIQWHPSYQRDSFCHHTAYRLDGGPRQETSKQAISILCASSWGQGTGSTLGSQRTDDLAETEGFRRM